MVIYRKTFKKTAVFSSPLDLPWLLALTASLLLGAVSLSSTAATAASDESLATELASASATEPDSESGVLGGPSAGSRTGAEPLELLERLQQEYGLFNPSIIEPLTVYAAAYQEEDEHGEALLFLEAAWQSSRRSFGLYHEGLITLLEAMIYSNLETQQWDAVDRYYGYLETLYTRLYDKTDPRLEYGLQQVSSWHVNALNTGIDNQQEKHLLAVRQVLSKRLESARLTLSADDPKLAYLRDGLRITEFNLRALKRQRHLEDRVEPRLAEDTLWADLNW